MIPLNKEFILRLACSLREAERSVHRGLTRPWDDLRQYYGSEKTDAVRELAEQIKQLVPLRVQSLPAPRRSEIGRFAPGPGFFQVVLGRWIGKCKKAWSYQDRALWYVATTLDALLRVLASPTRPTDAVLIDLRMDLSACEWVIEAPCPGMPELERTKRIEHFDYTPWVPHVKLAEVLAPLIGPAPGKKLPSIPPGTRALGPK